MAGSKTERMASRIPVLLLCLCLTGCGMTLPVPPTQTPTASPTAPIRAFPPDALNASWELDYVLVNGEKQPPYHPGQCLATSARPEQYYFFDGCNHGYCDTVEHRSASEKGDTRVMCSLTVQGCFEGTPTAGNREFVKWDKPFHDALMGAAFRAEVRDGALWVYARTEGNPTLVFKRMAGPCEAQAGYLKP